MSGICEDKLGITRLVETIVTKSWLYETYLKDDELEVDSRLKNWSKWEEIRQRQKDNLSKALPRNPNCLLMSIDHGTEINMEKWNLQVAAKYARPDRYRGHPDFWKVPFYIKPKDKCEPPSLFSSDDKYERWKEPPVAPREVVKQVYAEPEEICPHSNLAKWKKSSYRQARRKELKYELCNVEPEKAEVDGLFVVGHQFYQPQLEHNVNLSHAPNITLTGPADEEVCESTDVLPPSLEINGDIVRQGCQNPKTSWDVIFTKSHVTAIHERIISMKNLGSVVIHFKWVPVPPYRNPEMPLKLTVNMIPRFFFNKNDGAILPGQTYKHQFWFKSDLVGYYTESWKLLTEPKVSENDLEFCLFGIASEIAVDTSWEAVDAYIEKCRESTLAREAEQYRADSDREPSYLAFPYPQWYSEHEIFKSINQNTHYDLDKIKELKKIYKEITGEEWNLRLGDLYEAVNDNYEDIKVKTVYFQKIEAVIEDLRKSVDFTRLKERKLNVCYTIVSNFVSSLEMKALELQQLYGLNELPPIDYVEPEFVKSIPPTQPRVPMMEIEMTPKKGKTSKAGEGKKARKDKAGKGDKGKPKKVVKPKFIQLVVPEPKEVEEEETKEQWEPNKDRTNYAEHLYLFVYEFLEDAVDCITAAVDFINKMNGIDSKLDTRISTYWCTDKDK